MGATSWRNSSSWLGHRDGDRGRPLRPAPRALGAGFTLVELLVALAIFSAGVTILWGVFSATLTAWRRGGEYLADLRRQEFAADEIVAALRSLYHRADPEGRYGLVLETGTDPDAVTLRWVGLGGPGMPGMEGGRAILRRLTLGIETDPEGRRRAVLRAGLAFMPPDEERPDPVVRVWPQVTGLRCRVWNSDERQWVDEWKTTNAVPRAVELTIISAGRPDAPPLEIRRWVDLPVWAAAQVRGAMSARPVNVAPEPSPTGRGRRGSRVLEPRGAARPEP